MQEDFASLQKKVAEMDNKISQLTSEVQDALNINRTDIFKVSSRLESLIRHALLNKLFSVDELLLAIETYDKFRKAIVEIRKIESIPDKIEKAFEYNKENVFYHFVIYADDLELKPIFEKMGGPSSEIATKLLSSFQMSSSLREYLHKYAKD